VSDAPKPETEKPVVDENNPDAQAKIRAYDEKQKLLAERKAALGFLKNSFFKGDPMTKRVATVFAVSTLFAAVFAFLSVKAIIGIMAGKSKEIKVEDPMDRIADIHEKKHDKSEIKNIAQAYVGVFTVELKPPGGRKSPPGVLNIAEIEITMQCDSKETCTWVESHLNEVKDRVASVFIAFDREEVLSLPGKREMKTEIRRQVNALLDHGEITDVFFVRLIIN
jgi:flagellar basal body-associated protein FliL